MSDSDLGALYRAVRTRLLNDGAEAWGNRVYADKVPANVSRPYCLYQWTAGGETNVVLNPDPEHVLTIRCVAAEFVTAQAGAARIDALINDADYETAAALNGGDDWLILNATRAELVYIPEDVDGVTIYHHGARYRFRMEKI